MKERKQVSESFLLCVILALVGGFLDAYTYVCRDGVFANAETGNIVLMGIKLAKGEYTGALYYLIPIFGFALGVLVSEIIKKHFKYKTAFHWRQITVAVEIIVLLGISFVPSTSTNNIFTNALVALVCSIQVESFRQFSSTPITTTMCTGNLRSATENLFIFLNKKDKKALKTSMKYYSVIIFFIIGAALGAVTTNALNEKATLVACAGLAVAFILMFINWEEKSKNK